MKIKKIQIRNFRSLCNITIMPQDILALVGRNNSGKSNVIKALELFLVGSKKLVNEECFFEKCTENPIEIVVTFHQLTKWEQEKFDSWMDNDELTVEREIVAEGESYKINDMAVVRVPEPEWLQNDSINKDKMDGWWPNRANLKINGLDFGAELGTTKPTVKKWKETAKKFVGKHHDEITFIPVNQKINPGVLKGALPEFIYIPAVRDVSDEAKVTKTSPFGQLINSILEKISEEQKQTVSAQLKGIESQLNRTENGGRISEIKEIETSLNIFMREMIDGFDIEIEMAMPQLKEIFGSAKIYANDGVRTTIETKGHGLQRAMIFTILRAYAELSHSKKTGEKAEERTTIFGIEEPELYLHPQLQRTLMSVIRTIASGKDQVVYSTQSSLFVDISYFDNICIMRREENGGTYESHPSQLTMSAMLKDLKIRTGIEGTEEGMREQYSHVFNPLINEGFFADKVVIVEGPSEQYALPIYADALKYNLDRNNVSVVHSDGKGQMDRLMRVFNGFEIPTFLWFDGDKHNNDENITKKSLELLELNGTILEKIDDIKTDIADNYAILEFNFEETLKDEIPDYETLIQEANILGPTGKPLKHRFIAQKLKERVDRGDPANDVLPTTVISILNKIKTLTYPGSILEK